MKSLRVGLTGGIGSGKSAALEAFKKSGAAIISADAVVHALSKPGKPGYRAIVRAFGKGVLVADGALDRSSLGEKVFKNAAMRRKLEKIVHPIVRREMKRRINAARGPVVVVDVPLLFENGLEGEFDLTISVSAPRALRLKRVMRRDGLSKAAVERRMRAQLPAKEKEKRADVVLRNEGSLNLLRRSVGEYQRAFNLIGSSLRRSSR
ncbi:MAG: dephospho-CoA kinase [Elusimicrobia bacterium]|nr:MAG: dephospho-CoA kinase [Elusimicrobiota bacterium]